MHFSAVLSKRIKHDFLPVFIKKHWRDTGSRMVVKSLRVPQQVLHHPGVENLANAEDMFMSTRYTDEYAGNKNSAAKQLTRANEDPPPPAHSTPSLLFDASKLFTKDIAQACMLANAVVRPEHTPQGLNLIFQQVCELFKNFEKSPLAKTKMNGEEFDLLSAVEQAVLHAHVWRTDEDVLPRRYDPRSIIWKFKSELGIHPTNVVRYLFHNLFRLCELQSIRMNCSPLLDSGLPSRWVTRNRLLETYFHWGGNRRVQFTEKHDIVLCSTQPTTQFASPVMTEEDLETMTNFKQQMHLLSPLIDLTSTLNYRSDSSDGWISSVTPTYPFPNLITVNLALPNVWSDFTAPEKDRMRIEQRQAAGIMHCLASTIATAKRLYQDNENVNTTGQLPEPISVEAICSDGVYFDFIAFQLNTLHFPDWNIINPVDRNGCANFVWIDGNHRLVDKQYPKRSMLRNTKYVDLDVSVFYRMFASYLWGQYGQEILNAKDKCMFATKMA